jgi:hypothetical protein
MALRKTKIERIVDTVMAAAGLSEVETAELLEEHWDACSRRAARWGSPHRPEWRAEANSHRDLYAKGAGADPADPTVQQVFRGVVDVCFRPPRRGELS